MNYELAKQLKDVGFRQYLTVHDHIVCAGNELVHYPTLSELIEACGNVVLQVNPDLSVAHQKTEPGYEPTYFRGNTPEESVAKLWLALNDKSGGT